MRANTQRLEDLVAAALYHTESGAPFGLFRRLPYNDQRVWLEKAKIRIDRRIGRRSRKKRVAKQPPVAPAGVAFGGVR